MGWEFLSRPRQPKNTQVRLALPRSSWPLHDRQALEAAFAARELFDDAGPGAHLSPRVRFARETTYAYWLGHLARTEPGALRENIAGRVTPARIQTFAEFMARTNGGVSIAMRLHELRLMLALLAPEADWRWLLQICKQIQAQSSPRAKAPRLQDAAQVYALGKHLMDDADREANRAGKVGLKTALKYRDGLMIAALISAPLRRANFAGVELGREVQRIGQCYWFVLASEKVKNNRDLDYPLSRTLSEQLERYLSTYRPVITSAARHDGLWASAKGARMTPDGMYQAITKRTMAVFGCPMNPHLFRDSAVTFLAESAPEQARMATELLGNFNERVMRKHYMQAGAVKAARQMAKIISRIRHPQPIQSQQCLTGTRS